MLYRPFLTGVHFRLQPRHYLEIGVREGRSLALARCPAVGIDPSYAVAAELSNHVTLFRTTSDEYFAHSDPLAATGGEAFDLSFIDGLHLFEFAVRDFINVERYSSPTGVIIFDDVLPRTVDEAARQRHTQSWTGDVYHMLTVLARYRPELLVLPVATQPTGLLLVTDLDPTSTVLRDHYDDIMAEYRSPDPQPVPDIIFDRQLMLRPQRVLSSPMWDILKTSVASALPPATFRSRLVNAVVTSFGSAFGPASLPS